MNPQNAPNLLTSFISRFHLQLPHVMPVSRNTRSAAVLIPIICRAEPTLLLTRRADCMRKYAGQVAFPGGKTDADDGSAIITALREAHEEVAIPPQAVQVIGQLTPFDSISGFQVTPIVGLIPPDIKFHANPHEVAEIFEIPLYQALTLSRYHPLDVHRQGHSHRIYLSWYQNHFVWGLTAAIIHRLAKHVSI